MFHLDSVMEESKNNFSTKVKGTKRKNELLSFNNNKYKVDALLPENSKKIPIVKKLKIKKESLEDNFSTLFKKKKIEKNSLCCNINNEDTIDALLHKNSNEIPILKNGNDPNLKV